MTKQRELTELEKIEAIALYYKRGHRFSSIAGLYNSNQRGPSVEYSKNPYSPADFERDLPTIEEVEIKKITFLKHFKNMEEMVKSGIRKIEAILPENVSPEIKKVLERMEKISYIPPDSMLDDKEREHIAKAKTQEEINTMWSAEHSCFQTRIEP